MCVRGLFFSTLSSDGSCVCVFSQGSDGARKSALLETDEPLVYFYEDVRTLYEGFQRGIQVSSKHLLDLCDACSAVPIQNSGLSGERRLCSVFHLFPPVRVSLSPPVTSPERAPKRASPSS